VTYDFGLSSEAKLDLLHPDLVRVVWRAMACQAMDMTVIETARSPAQAVRTPLRALASRTARHIHGADGKAHAIDLAPFPIDWKDLKRFAFLAGLMRMAAQIEGVSIRWGGNWDGNSDFHNNSLEDLPHYELV
jgi:peptidoglycan L-alanyl-D-glutamate endopeptidase CwlK